MPSTMHSRRRPRPTSALVVGAAAAASFAALLGGGCHAIHLDVHVPLPPGCLKYHALVANRLLRQASLPPTEGNDTKALHPTEEVNLFADHTAHVTLYLADFDLEADAPAASDPNAAAALNQTKVNAFKAAISSVNFTALLGGASCPLSYANDPAASVPYTIHGAYTMLPVRNGECLQTLSTTLLHALQSFLKRPIVVPDWVASLPEPDRSAAIYRSRMYGSPNVLEGFAPHVTVGYDPRGQNDTASATASEREWRVEAMERWKAMYEEVRDDCTDDVGGIALGRNGIGGTVLAESRMGYWEVSSTKADDGQSGGSLRYGNEIHGDRVAIG